MSNSRQYRVHDAQGNLYGPADGPTLRQWVREGRIVAGMSIAEEGTTEWMEVTAHPLFAGMFGGDGGASGGSVEQTKSVAAVTEVEKEQERPLTYAAPPSQGLNIPGLISMIMGIIGALFSMSTMCCSCGLIGVPLAIAGLVLGIISLLQFRKEPDRYSGKPFAIVGVICSSVGILAGLAWVVFMLGMVIFSILKH